MKKDLQISKEIQDVVTALTVVFAISSINEVDGVSTINTPSVTIFDDMSKVMVLQNGMIVTINSINYAVSNVVNLPGGKSFDITAIDLVATEWNVAANFQTGSRIEVNNIISSNSGSLNRFPLIWLLPTTNEDHDQELLDFTATVNVVFVYKSNATDRTEKRIENNFEPIMQPLLTLFNLWLQSSDFCHVFEFFGHGKPIDFEKSNFPFYGTSDHKKQVITSVSTDAIEVNYDLNFKKQFD